MSLMSHLVAYSLRQVLDLPQDAAEQYADLVTQVGGYIGPAAKVVAAIRKRFADSSRKLPKALAKANDRACQALAVALAGDGWLDSVKVFFAPGDDKGLREEVSRLLKASPVPFEGTEPDFRRACLEELKRARKAGVF